MGSKKQHIGESNTLWIWCGCSRPVWWIVTKHFKLHFYNIFWLYSELKFLKRNLTDSDVKFSFDFSRNYDNKQLHEIQSAYFGHEAFTLLTAAYYVKGCNTDFNIKSNIDKDTGLTFIPHVIVSTQTKHERNTAFWYNFFAYWFHQESFSQCWKSTFLEWWM